MKVSVSMPQRDLEFLDAYVVRHALASRSAAMHRAVEALRLSALPGGYAEAWADWDDEAAGALWDATSTDGLG